VPRTSRAYLKTSLKSESPKRVSAGLRIFSSVFLPPFCMSIILI